jgi:hypothetical protein
VIHGLIVRLRGMSTENHQHLSLTNELKFIISYQLRHQVTHIDLTNEASIEGGTSCLSGVNVIFTQGDFTNQTI